MTLSIEKCIQTLCWRERKNLRQGATGTPAEFLYLMKQAFTEFTINGTTITVKKLDGSTTAATYTMDSATTPTSRTRAT